MPVCSDCGVNGGCGCLFTRRAGRLLCGLCSGVATLEKAAEIRYLRERQGIGQQRGREEKKMALKSVLAKQKPVVKKTHAPVALPKIAERFPDKEPVLMHSGWGSDENHAFLKKYAKQIGCRYWWNGLKDDVYKTGEQFKQASMVAIWNGRQFTTPLVAELCRKRGIPHFFFEWGMLPQSKTFFIDPKGFCGDSILNEDLSWVTEEDMEHLYNKRAELQKKYPLNDEGLILAPLQIHNDAQVLYYSRYRNMDEFIVDVEARYPEDRVVARPHPDGNKKHRFKRAEEIFEGEFLGWAARAKKVVGITSTCLYEAAVLGVPVEALGDHPLATHPPELHDKVAAGALALCVSRSGDLKPILDRFGYWPLKRG